MKVGLEKSFPMPGSPEVVWGFLQNIEGVARCMPGAKITERLDDSHYKGTIAVRAGPASMAFKGDIEVRELDIAQRTLRLIGKGSDSSGTSGASMDLTARIEPGATPQTSNLVGKSEVTMSGKAAAFGGRMMGTVADQILNQFAGNFAKQVSTAAAQAAAGTSAPGVNFTAQSAAGRSVNASPSVTSSATTPDTSTAGETTSANASCATTPSTATAGETTPVNTSSAAGSPTPAAEAMAAATIAAPSAAATSATPAGAAASATSAFVTAKTPSGLSTPFTAAELPDEPANEINALSLFWAVVRDWLRGLFRRKPA